MTGLAIGAQSLAAGSEVETLEAITQSDTTALNLTGNEFANNVLGNNGTNTLDGGGGTDMLSDREEEIARMLAGAEITAVVLSLPTTGPMLLNALKSQDMYLAGSFLMFLAFLIVVGVLVFVLAITQGHGWGWSSGRTIGVFAVAAITRQPAVHLNGACCGGIISAQIKSGTNQYHGDVFEFFRNDKLDATSYAFTTLRPSKDPFKWNQYGFTLGGPVWLPKVYNGKDKLFFMANYEALRRRQSGQDGQLRHLVGGQIGP